MERENRTSPVIRVGGSPRLREISNPTQRKSKIMAIRSTFANSFLVAGRTIGQLLGLELAVVVSDHSITLQMEAPDTNKRAWDPEMYKSGNLFVSGYANPIKPRVNQHPDLETPNTVDVQEVDVDEDRNKSSGDVNDSHAELITSGRYREFMRQDLISQLLTPESRWNLLVWAVLALGVLQFLAIIVTLYSTGTFG